MKTMSVLGSSLSIVLLLGVTCVYAQDYRGKVQGQITDTSRAAVPEAKVTLGNVKTGVQTTRQSNATGQYVFEYVEPGDYQLSVESAGFQIFLQKNISVQGRGDVTVNAVLQPGSTHESVVVDASPAEVEFNSATMSTTIDQKMANELPTLSRNPFQMALLDPAVLSVAYFATQPFVSWSASDIQIGGGSSYTMNTSDIMVDSTPVGIGAKTSYTPPMDSVAQVIIQENSVDASYGNSGGGVMQVVMKSGTNEWHGDAWYLGRIPDLQAWADRTVRAPNTTRQNMWGGALGNPIRKNKLFNYFVYEQWKMTTPSSWIGTVPTTAQASGDFSQSYNLNGTVQTIYDPLTSTFNSTTGLGSRTPFPGNKVPTNRIDPVAAKIIKDVWGPNNSGDNITGVNNFKSSIAAATNYYNFSDRVDYNINDKLRVYGRVDRFHTVVGDNNPTPNQSPAFVSPDGSARNAFTTSADAVYTLNATTVLNIHGDYNSFVDGYQNAQTLQNGYASIWSTPWYTTFNVDAPTLYPRMVINGTAFGSPWVYWYDSPHGESFNAKLSKDLGKHYLKFGFDYRRQVDTSISYVQDTFNFLPSMTANDFIQPLTSISGNGYASFLLGALDSSSAVYTTPHKEAHWRFYAGYAEDDYKFSQRITLNLGLRWEYEAPLTDPLNRLGRYLDLTSPNPTLQANPPAMPAAVTQYRSAGPIYNGIYNFETSSHPGMYNAPKAEFMPRVGLAYKIDDRTAFRFGYARYIMPFAKSSYYNSMGVAYPGLDASQSPLSPVLGVPQVFLQNPFPSTSPLVAPLGSQYGSNFGLGNALTWYKQDFSPGVNDRFNFSLQRQLPAKFLVDVTGFFNFGHNMPLQHDVNLVDPNLLYTYKGALLTQVTNPFYQYGTPLTFPGTLRSQPTVSINSLLGPYPQYGELYYTDDMGKDRYRALQLKVQRPFANGFNLLFAYNFNREETLQYFNNVQQYANYLSWQEGTSPRHRMSIAGTYELPFGKGRQFLAGASRALDAVVGGWHLSTVYTYHSGDFLQLGAYQMAGNPAISDPTPNHWFNTSMFQLLAPYTARTNPWTYPGLTGPNFWDLDMTLAKNFTLLERFKSEFKLSAYNVTNTLMLQDPDLNLQDSTFGQSLLQSHFQTGRQVELGLKIFF